jgi:phage terminase large subunit-like protein
VGGDDHISVDDAAADRVIRFINALTHTKDQWAKQPFALRPWQEQRIVRPLFGTLLPDGRRQYRTCYVEIPRKNGKTELAAAIALYMLLGDGVIGGEVYSAASDLEQASLTFNIASQMVRNDPHLSDILEIIPSRKRIIHHASGSFYRAIPADAGGSEGYNASAIIADELHRWDGHAGRSAGREFWNVLSTSTGARRQPLTFVITTAGFDRSTLCWDMHQHAERVTRDPTIDPTFLPVLYGAPVDAPWDDEAVWRAANPALEDFRSLEEMQTACLQAKEMPMQQNNFRRRYLCQWVEQAERWLPMEHWRQCKGEISDAELAGLPCFGGLDLGRSDDLSAFARIWVLPDGRRAVKVQTWMPEAAMQKHRTRPYSPWRAGGWLRVTEGNIADFDLIEREVRALCDASGVRELAYDQHHAEQMAQHLKGQGITVVPMSQGFNLNESLNNFADLVVSHRLVHDGNPLLDWTASNAVIRHGHRNDIRLDKDDANDKIDPIAALVMANARVIVQPEMASVYDTRGVLTL